MHAAHFHGSPNPLTTPNHSIAQQATPNPHRPLRLFLLLSRSHHQPKFNQQTTSNNSLNLTLKPNRDIHIHLLLGHQIVVLQIPQLVELQFGVRIRVD